MCLILLAWQVSPGYPLILAANRDEVYARPTAPAHFWTDRPDVLAGRDLDKGGTWLGVTRGGRLAAVTNYRDGRGPRRGIRSRGELVSSFLASNQNTNDYLQQVRQRGADYDGFNLLAGTLDGLFYYSNRGEHPTELEPGVHGLSNHLLDSPWPKVERGKKALAGLGNADRHELIDGLLAVLADQTQPPDHALPDTGVGQDWERALATAFIRTPEYGTRSSTVLLVDVAGTVSFIERTHSTSGDPPVTQEYAFALSTQPFDRG